MSPETGMTPGDDDATIAAWLDGALDDAARAAVEARLAAEPAFAARVEAARRTMARADALLEQVALPAGRGAADDLARIRDRLRATTTGAPAPGGRTATRATTPAAPRVPRGAWVALAAAAVVTVVALPTLLVWRTSYVAASLEKPPSEKLVLTDSAMPAAAPVVATVESVVVTAAPAARAGARAGTGADAAVAAAAARPPRADTAPARAPALVASAAPAAGAAPAADEAVAAAESMRGRADAAPRARGDDRALRQARDADSRSASAKVAESEATVAAAPPPAPAPVEGAAAAATVRTRAMRAATSTITDSIAITRLGAPPLVLRGAERVALDTLAAGALDGAAPDRPLVLARFRESSGRVVTVAMQRAGGAAERDPLWVPRGTLRARLLGEFTPATADSLLRRLASP